MTNPNLTHLVAILDRSGSMGSIKSDTEGGFNAFIEKQKEVAGEVRVTLVKFDNVIETEYSNKRLDEVPPLNLQPRGSTALYDAMGMTITRVGEDLAKLPEKDRPGSVIFLILTDGWENASREWNQSRLKDAVVHQTDKYGWQFIFLGSNQDAVLTARDLGIRKGSALTYTLHTTTDAFAAAANYSTNYRSAVSLGAPVAVAAASSSFTADTRSTVGGVAVSDEDEDENV